jgi:RHS repeat-associated protein
MPWITTDAENVTNQRYRYNGKEFVEMYGLDTYDYGFRGYYAAGGRFTSIDPLAEKYYSWSPYCYTLGNPIRYIDINGLAPGDPFKTSDAAAADWGKYYNGKSIKQNKEYGSAIYSTTKNGETTYYYTKAKKGTSGDTPIPYSRIPKKGELEGVVHSHAAYYDEEINGESEIVSDDFSDMDCQISSEIETPIYVTTPGGHLKKYDGQTGEETTIRDDMPKDERMQTESTEDEIDKN